MCHNLGISSVEDLSLNFTNNLLITWSPPSFYSDDIPQESITTYHVNVNQDGFVILDINTTNTFYQISSIITKYCRIYIVSVKAVIEQYSSLVTIDQNEENEGSKIMLIDLFNVLILHIIRLYY